MRISETPITPIAPGDPPLSGAPPFGQSWSRKDWFYALALVVTVLLAYQSVWKAGFIWDDDTLLTNNRLIRAADGLRWFWCSTVAHDYWPIT
jgi:hypothetical protein